MEYDENKIIAKYNILTRKLIELKFSITTMESATSGMIASLITDAEGSSAVFKGAFVAYSNEYKIKFGVPESTIEQYSVYSKETAVAMAKACRTQFLTDIGIGVTGTFGNVDLNNIENSKPGEVYFAIDFRGKIITKELQMEAMSTRHEYKIAVADKIYDTLMNELEKEKNI